MTAILAIDQSSKSSGWARIDGLSVDVGIAKTAADRDAVCGEMASRYATDDGVASVVAVIEDHRAFSFSRGNMSVRSLLGMGAARGRWEQALEIHGIRDIRYVEPRVWRSKVLGLGPRASGEQAKAAAVRHAYEVLGYEVGHDAAEALCMALYAQRKFKDEQPKPRKVSKPRKAKVELVNYQGADALMGIFGLKRAAKSRKRVKRKRTVRRRK